jgi:fructosamine-3-kinase
MARTGDLTVIEQFLAQSDQSVLAETLLEQLTSALSHTTDRLQRTVLIRLIDELQDLPQTTLKEKRVDLREGRRFIDNSSDYLKKLRNYLDFFSEQTSIIIKQLEYSFIPEEGFYWVSRSKNNVLRLVDLHDKATKVWETVVSKDEDTIKALGKCLEQIKMLSSELNIKENRDVKKILEKLQGYIKDRISLGPLLKELLEESSMIIEKRKNLKANFKSLNNSETGIRLNDLGNKIREVARRLQRIQGHISEYLERLITTISSLRLLFPSKLKISKIPKILDQLKRNKDALQEPYYAEAKTEESYYIPKTSRDSVGVFNREESYHRLFLEEPKFENEKFYDYNANINSLIKTYFSVGDPMINNFRGYREELLDLVENTPKLDQQIKCTLVIPAYQEEGAILNTLKKYSSCNNIENVAIFIFENMPKGKKRDNTQAQIQIFREINPNVKVYHIFKQFKIRMPIGYIRKYITDYVLLLKQKSEHQGNLILVGGDADCVEIHPRFFSTIMKRFESNPYLDAMEMKLEFPTTYLVAFPNLWITHKLFDFTWRYMHTKINPKRSIRMYGPASAIKASSYLMIGGFNPRNRLCEDLQLSWLLDSARRSAKDQDRPYFMYSLSHITTNPRRILGAHLSNVSYFDMYEQFEEKENIRQLSWTELVDEKGDGILYIGNTYSKEEIHKSIEYPDSHKYAEINRTLAHNLQRFIDWWQLKVQVSRWLSLGHFQEMFSWLMNLVGIEYSLEFTSPHWTITILNADRLIAGMNVILKRQKAEGLPTFVEKINVDPATYVVKKREDYWHTLPKLLQTILTQIYGHEINVSQFFELGGGMYSKVYKVVTIEGTVILKTRTKYTVQLEKENAVLEKLKLLNVAAPRPLKQGIVGSTVYLATTEIKGNSMKSLMNSMGKTRKIALSKEVAEFLGNLHQIKGKYFGDLTDFKNLVGEKPSWSDYFLEKLWGYLNRKNEAFTPEEIRWVRELFDRNKKLFLAVRDSTLTHNDLWSENIMVSMGRTLSGILDLESVILADNEYEVALFEAELNEWGIDSKAFRRDYEKIIPLSKDYEKKKLLYQLQRYVVSGIRRNTRGKTVERLMKEVKKAKL